MEHVDKLSQAQGTSEISYHNYLTLLCTTAFQLDLKRHKLYTHHTQVNNTNSTSNQNNNKSGCDGRGHSQNGSFGGCDHIIYPLKIPITSLDLGKYENPSQLLPNLLFHDMT